MERKPQVTNCQLLPLSVVTWRANEGVRKLMIFCVLRAL